MTERHNCKNYIGHVISVCEVEPVECHHDGSTLSTLRTIYATSGDGLNLWMVECSVCHRATALYLTQGEAWQRALRGWWSNEGLHS